MPSRLDQLRSESRTVSFGHNRSDSVDSQRTAVGEDKIHLTLTPGAELPTVPYKLRFALSPDEWDRRMQYIAHRTEGAARPVGESIYFFICCICIPAGVGWPLFLLCKYVATHDDNEQKIKATSDDKIMAVVIPSVLALILFLLFVIPLFIRKYVLQRRMNKETRAWELVDLKKLDKRANIQWRVRLPIIFGSTTAIQIPVPPRPSDDEALSDFSFPGHSRNNSTEEVDVEALGGAGLARSDSIGQRTLFERP